MGIERWRGGRKGGRAGVETEKNSLSVRDLATPPFRLRSLLAIGFACNIRIPLGFGERKIFFLPSNFDSDSVAVFASQICIK